METTPVFGNPDIIQLNIITNPAIFDTIFNSFEKPFPLVLSDAMQHELVDISKKISTVSDAENADVLNRYMLYDRNICQAIFNVVADNFEEYNNDETRDLIHNIFRDCQPIILKYKFRHNRPRPNQCASYLKLKLFPFSIKNTPSYPSGTAISAILILEVLGNRFPQHYEFLMRFKDDITSSRIYLGHNYRSDIDYSYEIAKKILTNSVFTNKYKV